MCTNGETYVQFVLSFARSSLPWCIV